MSDQDVGTHPNPDANVSNDGEVIDDIIDLIKNKFEKMLRLLKKSTVLLKVKSLKSLMNNLLMTSKNEFSNARILSVAKCL